VSRLLRPDDPRAIATIEVLVDASAKVDARNAPGTETPLHWAASSDDIDALDALVAAGADIEAPGAVIAGGTPLDDAVAFGQWQAARRWSTTAHGPLYGTRPRWASSTESTRTSPETLLPGPTRGVRVARRHRTG
jgi:hypothetical protein